jgi:hypothetical protein
MQMIAMFAAAACTATAVSVGRTESVRRLQDQLAAALAQQDAAAIGKAAARLNQRYGKRAGVPEVPDKYLPIPKAGAWLTAVEAAPGFEPWFSEFERRRWWRIGMDPLTMGHPLREPADAISGNIAVVRAGLRGAERSLKFAKEAGDFLVWAQARGEAGVFPFPASRGVSREAPFLASERQLRRAERSGRLKEIVTNGWAVSDQGNGGLQFDNGECGVALLELHEVTNETKYLTSAKQSADWALAQPLVANWNYNSFSVHFLARAYRVTGERKYLEGATQKALLGVIPGQLTQGPRGGRWGDAHNARPSYHYIILRSLAELAAALPADNVDSARVTAALRLGLTARNKDFLGPGAPNKDMAMETLLLVNRAFASDGAFLRDTLSADALDALAKLVSGQARAGGSPLGPKQWGQFLEYVVWKGSR